MGPVHLYLAAWVAGGVLLGASMLLDGREGDADESPFEHPDAFSETARAPASSDGIPLPVHDRGALSLRSHRGGFARASRIAPLGLIGFGLCGLTAKGLNLDIWPWSFVCALLVGAGLVALGYRLSRPRRA